MRARARAMLHASGLSRPLHGQWLDLVTNSVKHLSLGISCISAAIDVLSGLHLWHAGVLPAQSWRPCGTLALCHAPGLFW